MSPDTLLESAPEAKNIALLLIRMLNTQSTRDVLISFSFGGFDELHLGRGLFSQRLYYLNFHLSLKIVT